METMTLTDEQFSKLIDAIRPGQLAAPVVPSVEKRERQVALAVLREVENFSFWGADETPLASQLRELCKAKV